MNYIIVGFLVSIGWHIAKVIFEVAEELLFERLHDADWYLALAGKELKNINKLPGDAKKVKNQIGFYYKD
jgi:hypothetical protein